LNPALADRVDFSEVTFWDGWPDGEFERDFTWQEMADTKDLMVHWAYRLKGGDRKGDIFGDTWPEGKHMKRWCLGTIVCDNEECETMVRPQTKPEGISKQLLSKCQCGALLRHDECGLVSELWKYKDGVHDGQHFRAGVTRISKIGGVIPQGSAESFKSRVAALLEAPDIETFLSCAEVVIRAFPKTETWLQWWMRDAHASMLFASQRKMDPHIWDRMPDTTNAEEAMHWKLYSAVGRNLSLMEGLRGLHAVAEYYLRIYTASLSVYLCFCSRQPNKGN
jgi:hypothetical protein